MKNANYCVSAILGFGAIASLLAPSVFAHVVLPSMKAIEGARVASAAAATYFGTASIRANSARK